VNDTVIHTSGTRDGSMSISRLLGLLALAALAAAPAYAQRYSAVQQGDIVTLTDRGSDTVVSVVPSVGNIAFEMKVTGINVLQWPYASVEDFKARPGLSAIPFLAPWANRLDEQAFYANGKRYAFDMQLGNVTGAIPIHGFMSRTDQWQVIEMRHLAFGAPAPDIVDAGDRGPADLGKRVIVEGCRFPWQCGRCLVHGILSMRPRGRR